MVLRPYLFAAYRCRWHLYARAKLTSTTSIGNSFYNNNINNNNNILFIKPAALLLSPKSVLFSTLQSHQSQNQRLFPEEINILYDSQCNVCKLEIDFLSRRDHKLHGGGGDGNTFLGGTTKLKLTDLEDANYNPNDPANGGVTYERGMKSIHAVLKDGTVIDGPEVFRIAYQQVNLGWAFQFITWPIFAPLVKWGYKLFAKYRTNLTRGTSVDELVRVYEVKRRAKQEGCEQCVEK